MADRSEHRYVPGRGIPCYLLDRVGDDSSIYSDGASRIFIGTDSSSSIENNTDTSDSINTLSNSSLFNLSTVGSMTDTLRISDQNLLQYQSSINISSIDSELCDSRNTECDIGVSLNNLSLMNTVHEEANEVKMLSNTSLMDVGYLGSEFAYFPLGFAQKGDQRRSKRDQDRTRQALSNARFTFSLTLPQTPEKSQILKK